ncbi:MAG: hypothetical protein ACFCUX_08940 [Candidatus Methylacidiphilales bacterium]
MKISLLPQGSGRAFMVFLFLNPYKFYEPIILALLDVEGQRIVDLWMGCLPL